MVMGWSLLMAITTVLVFRWRSVDEVFLIALVALTPFLLVPLVLADIFAWFSRSASLRVAAVAVTGACLFTVAPFDAVVGCRPSTGDGAITIITANVLRGGGRADAVADTIASTDPDVVFLQEANSRFVDELAEQGVLEPWRYRSNEFPGATRGDVLWSKWPLSDVRHDELGTNSSVRALVEAPQGRFTAAGVHAASPRSRRNLDKWHREYEILGNVPTDAPMVMGGDFNATEDHRPFRSLLDKGWTDVHDNKGCGPDLTWPTRGLPFPVMRLDHILVTDDFEVLSTEIGEAGGSDHYPVISRIRFAGG